MCSPAFAPRCRVSSAQFVCQAHWCFLVPRDFFGINLTVIQRFRFHHTEKNGVFQSQWIRILSSLSTHTLVFDFQSNSTAFRFDYPTLTALADYVSEQLLPDSAPATVAPIKSPMKAAGGVSGVTEHLAVLGGACHLPGCQWCQMGCGFGGNSVVLWGESRQGRMINHTC